MATITVPIQAKVFWVVAQDKRSHYWVAQCPPLQIVAEGKTFSELTEVIDECLQALFSELVQTGDFESFLREHGWKAMTPLPTNARTSVRFDIPYELQRRSTHDFEAVPC